MLSPPVQPTPELPYSAKAAVLASLTDAAALIVLSTNVQLSPFEEADAGPDAVAAAGTAGTSSTPAAIAEAAVTAEMRRDGRVGLMALLCVGIVNIVTSDGIDQSLDVKLGAR
ncbi:hypothetical protein GCM10022200_26330 [Microbacterium awajiense]|uniref:Uncharacterized protein n=1 Tax=Microbacterium awajiense TaxID=415214 RepID=A0ABP7AV29_9MICO